MTSTIVGLDHLQIAAPPDAENAARAFYGGLLGLDEIPVPEALRHLACCWFRCGAIEIHIGVQADFRPAKKAHPAFSVSGLDDLAVKLRRQGSPVRIDDLRPGLRRFFTEDPWGNRLEFVEAGAMPPR